MSIWPYLPVWPFLLLGCAIASLYNWRAALACAIAVIAVKVVKATGFEQEQIIFFAIYSGAGLASYLWLDRVAGYFLAAIGLLYIAHIIGAVGQYPKVILAEALLVSGLVAGALGGGPTGGILALVADLRGGRYMADREGATGIVAPNEATERRVD